MVAENCTLANNTNLDDPATGQETILEEFCPVQTVSNSSYNPMPATSDDVVSIVKITDALFHRYFSTFS